MLRHRYTYALFQAFLALLLVGLPNFRPAFAQQTVNVTPVSVPSLCNSVAFEQIPGNSSYFIGRRIINTTSDPCSGSNMALSLFQMDWGTHTLNLVRDILVPPITFSSQQVTVTSTYDPTIASFNGQLWLAFECMQSGTTLAASCVAPMSSSDFSVDTSRATLVVQGGTYGSDSYSASVPKIFVYQNNPYLYWSVSHFTSGANGALLTDTTTRGAELTQEASGAMRLWVSGSGNVPVGTLDGSTTTEVLGTISTSSISNNVADSFDVLVSGSNVLLTSGVGGKGCTDGLSPAYACYRLAIRSAPSPLGQDIFNSSFLSNTPLPFNPGGYYKFIVDPNGNQYILGYFQPPITNGSPLPSNSVAVGQGMFPVQPQSFQFSSVDPTPLPSPTINTAYLPTTFTAMQQFVSTCDENSPLPNSQDIACLSASSRFCKSQGYAIGGLLEEINGNNALVACATSGAGVTLDVGISSIAATQPGCTTSNLVSDVCNAGIDNYCSSIGYTPGGFGPEEAAGSIVNISCLNSSWSTMIASTYQALTAQNALCTASSSAASLPCVSAVNRVCASMGYLAGYGISQHAGNNVLIGCFKNSGS
jgi:hypothetical protein